MKEVSLSEAWNLLYPRQTVLIVSMSKEGKPNVMALDWSAPASFSPPMLTIAVGKKRYSCKLISETKEFVLAIPKEEMEEKVLFCGKVSGRSVDKFKEAKLTPLKAKHVKAPLIKECIANLECKVVKEVEAGDHILFLAEVLAAYANEGKALINLGNQTFIGLKRIKFFKAR